MLKTLAIYCDRYTEVAGKSKITDQGILVHYFADGPKGKKIREKIIRGKCKTINQAITIGVEKETYL